MGRTVALCLGCCACCSQAALSQLIHLVSNNMNSLRQFTEDDESLTADEKALLRFQKQRMQELAGAVSFLRWL